MQRQEFGHNTPAQVRHYLTEALAIVEEINPPGELREAVFIQACALTAAKQIVFGQPAPMALPDLGNLSRRH